MNADALVSKHRMVRERISLLAQGSKILGESVPVLLWGGLGSTRSSACLLKTGAPDQLQFQAFQAGDRIFTDAGVEQSGLGVYLPQVADGVSEGTVELAVAAAEL